MADFADIAQDITENALANAIRARKVLTLPFSGLCLACNEPVEQRRFCGPDCREHHAITLRRRAINPAYELVSP